MQDLLLIYYLAFWNADYADLINQNTDLNGFIVLSEYLEW
jgi:hypothetical protein